MKVCNPYASTDGTVLAEYLIASTLGIADAAITYRHVAY